MIAMIAEVCRYHNSPKKSVLCDHEVVFLTCIFTGKWETAVGVFFC